MAALLLPFCVSYSLLAAPRPPTVQRAAVLALADEEPHATLIFIRHGQSEWNAASLFTGWADVGLTTLGKNEAAQGATQLWREGLTVDVAFTSLLKRAQQTLDIVLKITGQEDVQVHQDWRLNERMYGALTGLNKKETVAKYGACERYYFTYPSYPGRVNLCGLDARNRCKPTGWVGVTDLVCY